MGELEKKELRNGRTPSCGCDKVGFSTSVIRYTLTVFESLSWFNTVSIAMVAIGIELG